MEQLEIAMARITALERQVERLNTLANYKAPVWLATPLTPINGFFSTVAVSTEITYATLGTPAVAKAIVAQLYCKDSAVNGSQAFWIGPTATYYYAIAAIAQVTNYNTPSAPGLVPTDPNGSVWYRATASGTNTLTVTMRVWGYFL
jgi:hypothetical protein